MRISGREGEKVCGRVAANAFAASKAEMRGEVRGPPTSPTIVTEVGDTCRAASENTPGVESPAEAAASLSSRVARAALVVEGEAEDAIAAFMAAGGPFLMEDVHSGDWQASSQLHRGARGTWRKPAYRPYRVMLSGWGGGALEGRGTIDQSVDPLASFTQISKDTFTPSRVPLKPGSAPPLCTNDEKKPSFIVVGYAFTLSPLESTHT